MRTFKKISLFFLLNGSLVAVLSFFFTDINMNGIRLRESRTGKFSQLIIGQSQAETGLNPFILGDNTGFETYNIAHSMPTRNLFYYLKEANGNGRLKSVIYELDSAYWYQDHFSQLDSNIFWELHGCNQLDYFMHVGLPLLWKEPLVNTIAKYGITLGKIMNARENIQSKLHKESTSMKEIEGPFARGEKYEYIGRGFRAGRNRDYKWWSEQPWNENELLSPNVKAFHRIACYCRNNDIKLICVQTILPPFRLKADNNREKEHDYFSSLCNDEHIPFYDLNYLRRDVLAPRNKDYVDGGAHPMGYLADEQSRVLADILTAENTSIFFYENYEQVLAHTPEEDWNAPTRGQYEND